MNTMFVEYRLKSIEADQKEDGFYFEFVPVSQSLKLFVKSTEEAFSPSEYRQLVPLKCTDKGKFGYKLFLLSKDEYEKYRSKIPNVNSWWWLRSPGLNTALAALVNHDGSVYLSGFSVYDVSSGVRPALRLRRS